MAREPMRNILKLRLIDVYHKFINELADNFVSEEEWVADYNVAKFKLLKVTQRAIANATIDLAKAVEVYDNNIYQLDEDPELIAQKIITLDPEDFREHKLFIMREIESKMIEDLTYDRDECIKGFMDLGYDITEDQANDLYDFDLHITYMLNDFLIQYMTTLDILCGLSTTETAIWYTEMLERIERSVDSIEEIQKGESNE